MLIQGGRRVEPEDIDMAQPWYAAPHPDEMITDEQWTPPATWPALGFIEDGPPAPFAAVVSGRDAAIIRAGLDYLPPGIVVMPLDVVFPPLVAAQPGAGCWHCIAGRRDG